MTLVLTNLRLFLAIQNHQWPLPKLHPQPSRSDLLPPFSGVIRKEINDIEQIVSVYVCVCVWVCVYVWVCMSVCDWVCDWVCMCECVWLSVCVIVTPCKCVWAIDYLLQILYDDQNSNFTLQFFSEVMTIHWSHTLSDSVLPFYNRVYTNMRKSLGQSFSRTPNQWWLLSRNSKICGKSSSKQSSILRINSNR